ncbi:hypothetical protein ICE_05711 [Bacillus cereus BAG1X1-2]|nr:hypothetical protein ICE_05711 [Bacillus cereus BAG1X1-2]
MILKELADASLQYSDNNAQNLILKQLGRPREFQNSMREIRDAVTNTERFKSELNVVHPGDNLIRAGVPGGWEVADKTDSESYGIRNDIEIIRSPNNFDTF